MSRALLLLALLTSCGDLMCGWKRNGTIQLEPLPAGRCWHIVTPPRLATTRAGEHVDACSVETGDRIYEGGTVIDHWGETDLDGAETLDLHAEAVDCPADLGDH